MYKLLVKWFDLTNLQKVMSEQELRSFILNNTKSVKYSEVITPSGVTKDITDILNSKL